MLNRLREAALATAEPTAAAPAPSGGDPVIAAGYVALITHSGVFIAGRSFDDHADAAREFFAAVKDLLEAPD